MHLVELALENDQQGIDCWELQPLTPLSSPDLAAADPLPDALSGQPGFDQLPPAVLAQLPFAVPPSVYGNGAHTLPSVAPEAFASKSEAEHSGSANTGPLKAASGAALGHSNTHARDGKRARRQRQRAAAKEAGLGKKARSSYSKRASQAATLKGQLELRQLPIATGAFQGQKVVKSKRCRTLDELLASDYEYFQWDGMYAMMHASSCILLH